LFVEKYVSITFYRSPITLSVHLIIAATSSENVVSLGISQNCRVHREAFVKDDVLLSKNIPFVSSCTAIAMIFSVGNSFGCSIETARISLNNFLL